MEILDRVIVTNIIILISLYFIVFAIGEKEMRLCIKDKNIPVLILLLLILISLALFPILIIAKIWI